MSEQFSLEYNQNIRLTIERARQTVSTLRGMRKYSIVRARAKLLGGMMQTSP